MPDEYIRQTTVSLFPSGTSSPQSSSPDLKLKVLQGVGEAGSGPVDRSRLYLFYYLTFTRVVPARPARVFPSAGDAWRIWGKGASRCLDRVELPDTGQRGPWPIHRHRSY
jgi:hypothetical protein